MTMSVKTWKDSLPLNLSQKLRNGNPREQFEQLIRPNERRTQIWEVRLPCV